MPNFSSLNRTPKTSPETITKDKTSMYIIMSLVVAILWAYYPFIVRYTEMPPITIWVYSSILASIGAVIVLMVTRAKIPSLKEAPTVILASLIGPLFGTLLFIYVLSIAPSATVAITLCYTSPLFALIIGFFMYKEMITFRQLLGGICILVGIILISSHRSLQNKTVV